MKKRSSFIPLMSLLFVSLAHGEVIVSNLTDGVRVNSSFRLQARAPNCGAQRTSAMGYSFNDSTQTTIIDANVINALVTAPTLGTHILHVKCWGIHGAAGVTNIRLRVTTGPFIPAKAAVVSNIQQLTDWKGNHDPGTNPGKSSGSSALVNAPSLTGQARRFSVRHLNYGGHIFHTVFGIDTWATHFVYDVQLYISGSAAGIGNIEMDLNQVTSDGRTILFGFQCDGYSATWDYTINAGSPTDYVDKWVHSTTPCPPPRTWSVNTWHRIQIVESRDGDGNVTYESVWLDGVEYPLKHAVGNSAFALGWGSVLLTNFQIDGLGPKGSSTTYLDNLTVYRW